MIARVTDSPRQPRRRRAALPGPAHVLWRHRWIFLAIVASALLDALPFALLQHNVYTGSAQIYVQPAGSSGLNVLSQRLPAVDLQRFAENERALIASSAVLGPAARRPEMRGLKTFAGTDDVVAYLQDELHVEVGKADDSIRISLDSAQQNEPAKIVGAVLASYIAFRGSGQSADNSMSLQQLLDERSKCAAAIALKRDQMQVAQKSAGAASLDDPNPPAVQALAKLNESLETARHEEAAAKSESESASADYPRDVEHARLLAEARKNPSLGILSADDFANMRSSLRSLQDQLSGQRRSALGANAHYRVVLDEYQRTQALYVAASEWQLQRARNRTLLLLEACDQQNTATREFIKKAEQYSGLAGEYKVLEARLENLDAQIRQANPATAPAPSITVLQQAFTPSEPTSPHRGAIMGWSLLAGLIAAVLVAYFQEMRSPRLHTPADVEAVLGLNVLGVVPRIIADPTRADFSLPADDVTQVCEAIVNELKRAAFDEPVRTVLIASPGSGDGRSTLAKNLAIVAAQAGSAPGGRSVLLVDGNMRTPSLHEIFSDDNRRGLSSVLMGAESLASAIVQTLAGRLDLLPSGPASVDPSELLDAERLGALLKEMKRNYDLVIIDSPPALSASDARQIGALCDATLVLVRAGRTEQRLARTTCEQLRQVDARVIGIVMNQRPARLELSLGGSGARRWLSRLHDPIADMQDEPHPAGASGEDY